VRCEGREDKRGICEPLDKIARDPCSKGKTSNSVDSIDFFVPKRRKTSLASLATTLEKELVRKESFVTGNIDPSFFSDEYSFQDPDVKIKGIESYARGVNKIFSQDSSRMEVVAVRVNETVADTLK
jgi:hypothetical protein